MRSRRLHATCECTAFPVPTQAPCKVEYPATTPSEKYNPKPLCILNTASVTFMLVKTRVLQLMLLAKPKSHSLTGLLQNKISVVKNEQSALDAAISSNENVLGLHVPMNDSETGFR